MNISSSSSLEDVKLFEMELCEWSKETPIVYMDHIVRKYKKRLASGGVSFQDYIGMFFEKCGNKSDLVQRTIFLHCEVSECSLPLSSFGEMLEEMLGHVEKCKIAAGTMVGIQAAQSVGESMTQLCLNTFHSSGAKRSMATGVSRLVEILDCTKTLSSTFFICPGVKNPADLLETKVGSLVVGNPFVVDTATGEVVQNLHQNNTKGPWEVVFRLSSDSDWDMIKGCGGISKIVLSKLTYKDREMKLLVKSQGVGYCFQKIREILDSHLSGVPGALEVTDNTVFLSPNIRVNVSLDDFPISVDLTKIVSNDVHFIKNTFGIEAARRYLLNELVSVLGNEGVELNIRHLMLIVDNMTYQGDLNANRYGSISMDENVILKASFQQATETFSAAASRGVVDPLLDVSSQIMMGKRPAVGAYSDLDVLVTDVVEKESAELDDWSGDYVPAPTTPRSSDGGELCYVPASPPHEMLEMDLDV